MVSYRVRRGNSGCIGGAERRRNRDSSSTRERLCLVTERLNILYEIKGGNISANE